MVGPCKRRHNNPCNMVHSHTVDTITYTSHFSNLYEIWGVMAVRSGLRPSGSTPAGRVTCCLHPEGTRQRYRRGDFRVQMDDVGNHPPDYVVPQRAITHQLPSPSQHPGNVRTFDCVTPFHFQSHGHNNYRLLSHFKAHAWTHTPLRHRTNSYTGASHTITHCTMYSA
jgi:hypothetical protein